MVFRISIALVIWAVLTITAFYLIQRYKSERASLIGGLFFLVATIAGVLLGPVFLGVQERCTTYTCATEKTMVDALVIFFTISWGALGANLLSACISHK